MKANLAVPHPAYQGTFNLIGGAPQLRSFADRAATLVRVAFAKLVQALRPVSFEEAYLSQAKTHADLERRMFELSSGDYEASRRFFY